jgi:hypothetical protein
MRMGVEHTPPAASVTNLANRDFHGVVAPPRVYSSGWLGGALIVFVQLGRPGRSSHVVVDPLTAT